VENATLACSGGADTGVGLAGVLAASWAGRWLACSSPSRGTLATATTTATNEIWRIQAVRVDTPGIADLMKFGTIYTT